MTDFSDNREPFSDAEALVRAAAGYVRPSENLRPRVLEVARTERSERRALRQVWHLALVVALLGMFTSTARTRSSIAPTPAWENYFQPAPPLDSSNAALRQGSNAALRQGEFGWDTVESFRELRRRQAELLRVAM